MLDPKEIAIEISRLEYGESSYPAYAKLATLYTIRNQMEKEEKHEAPMQYSLTSSPETEPTAIPTYGDSEFLAAVSGKDQAQVWEVIDDLMDTLRVTNPRAYRGVMRRIYDI